jgi:hypothetical protein
MEAVIYCDLLCTISNGIKYLSWYNRTYNKGGQEYVLLMYHRLEIMLSLLFH